ncbi:carboxypeptidase-like regulatory domain-containing protein [Agarilytica rhodophyticola]|uniref:carboxypeptidase-like regulatory domain-containing protein n=1 Tax=Agarilytica rhodophyticola TaxID=1737490 RepID=UPI000B347A97|nr:carboxypeptidase-like regulatory domain-containing protein [Agarilytica rhodophyticola]
MKFAAALCVLPAIFVVACGGGGSESSNSNNSQTVTIQGKVTYDFVPHTSGGALDYNNTSRRPVPSARIQLLDSDGNTLDGSSTDADGNYQAEVPANAEVRVRVLAQFDSQFANISVTDNTRGNALYVLDGELRNSGNSNSNRDLHAASGWTGSGYGNERAAAPFAILDSVYQAVKLVQTADSNVSLPALEMRWSVNNIAVVSQNAASGRIGTSKFDGTNIFILGHEDNDTDEYDRSVIQHEFGHYLERTLFRLDSEGGRHSRRDQLDSRVAFSEGWSNAFAAMASSSTTYQDSMRKAQASGFRYSLENNTIANLGWYSENSVSQIVYDIYDSDSDSSDNISLGFTPIYQAMRSDEYRRGTAVTNIYSFTDALKNRLPINDAGAIDDLMEANDIFGTGPFGIGETNNGGQSISLPVYHELSVGAKVNLCSDKVPQVFNGIGVRRLVRLNISQNDDYTIRAEKTRGRINTNPNMRIYRNGSQILELDSSVVDIESRDDVQLDAGDYLIELFDLNNMTFGSNPGGLSCFDLSIN